MRDQNFMLTALSFRIDKRDRREAGSAFAESWMKVQERKMPNDSFLLGWQDFWGSYWTSRVKSHLNAKPRHKDKK